MSHNSLHTPWSDQTLFSRTFFSIYDWCALGLHCRLVWQCSTGRIVEFYNQHISTNHIDVGVGTGYFLDKCRLPAVHPRLALLDINPLSLTKAQKRLRRYQPEVYQRNVLEPLNIPGAGFDSISLTHVLHCLPGNLDRKAIVFQNLLPLLNPGGIIFGATFLYLGVKHTPLTRFTFWWTNQFHFMSNKQDSLEDLSRILKHHFSEFHIELCGSEALFYSRK